VIYQGKLFIRAFPDFFAMAENMAMPFPVHSLLAVLDKINKKMYN